MEVKAGFKQTDIGIFPNDWVIKSIKELNVDLSDGNYSSKYPKASDFRSMGVPFIRANNIRNMTVVDDDLRYISEAQHAELLRGHLKKNDILITTRGEIGQIAFVPDRHIGSNINAQLVRINLDKTGNDGRYVGYVLSFDETKKRFEDLQTGSALKQLPVGKFITLVIPFPPTKAEQKAIADALSDVDVLIEALEQLIAKKRQVKQGAMQELLTGKRRLPGSNKTEIVQTEIGRFPADWILTPLGVLVDPTRSIRYGIVQPGDYDRQGRFMIRGQDYSKGWVEPSEVFRVSDAVEAKYKNARVKAGDLIMTIVGTCGLVETIPDWLDGANLTQTTARIAILPSKANSTFCKYMLQTEAGSLQVNNFMKGAVQPGLNCADVEKFLVPLPTDKEEQTAIAEILGDMDADITALEGKLSKARQVKAGMMQELLTGRVRLV